MADFLSSILFIFDYLLILNFVLLVLTYSIFRNIIGQNKIRFIFDFLYSVILLLELVSFWAIDGWVGYAFIANLDPDLIAGFIGDFTKEALIVLFITSFFYSITLFVSKQMKRFTRLHFFLLLPLILILMSDGFILNGLKNTVLETANKGKNLDDLLPEYFIERDNVWAQPGKNIIYLSIESLEKNFLDHKYGNHTPYLNNLSEKYNFYELKQDGLGWTSASLYTLFTSIPAYYSNFLDGNYRFQSIYDFRIPVLGSILNEAGYRLKYVMADPEFSGTNYLLESNFFEIIDSTNDGLEFAKIEHDLELFEELKEQVLLLKSSNEQFALFASTIDTHFPTGRYDKNMENYLNKSLNDFENEIDFSIEAIDYLIGDFISFLEKENILDNTVFFIAPDHKIMGKGSYYKKLNEIGNRNLFLLTNSVFDIDRVAQTRMARIILSGANVETNAILYSDNNQLTKLTENDIAKLNELITVRENWKNGIKLFVRNKTLSVEGDNFSRSILVENDDVITFNFDQNFTFMRYIRGNKELPSKMLKNQIKLVLKIKDYKLANCLFQLHGKLDIPCKLSDEYLYLKAGQINFALNLNKELAEE